MSQKLPRAPQNLQVNKEYLPLYRQLCVSDSQATFPDEGLLALSPENQWLGILIFQSQG